MNKKFVLMAVLLICLLPVLLIAGDDETVLKQGNKTIIIKKTGDMSDSDIEELQKLKLDVQMEAEKEMADDAPFFGIYPAALDFSKAQELNYPNSYGILITGVVPNSAAYQYRLAEDDILMEIDGKKVIDLKELDKIKSVYRAGDAVTLTIFRAGEQKRIDFVFGSRPKAPKMTIEKKIMGKKALSGGTGGGTWIPMWFSADMEDVNELVQTIGFSKLPEDGVLTQGFGGKGNVGKNWFIGGQFHFYWDTKKINEVIDADSYTNSMDYNMFIGGATLDKRIPITKNVVTSLGLMIGGGSHTVELVHTNGDYNWPVATEDDPNPNTQDIMSANSYAKMSKGYILVQPRAEIMIRLLS